MATRNCKYGIAELSDNWTGASVKGTRLAVAMDTEVAWGEIACICRTKTRSLALLIQL